MSLNVFKLRRFYKHREGGEVAQAETAQVMAEGSAESETQRFVLNCGFCTDRDGKPESIHKPSGKGQISDTQSSRKATHHACSYHQHTSSLATGSSLQKERCMCSRLENKRRFSPGQWHISRPAGCGSGQPELGNVPAVHCRGFGLNDL